MRRRPCWARRDPWRFPVRPRASSCFPPVVRKASRAGDYRAAAGALVLWSPPPIRCARACWMTRWMSCGALGGGFQGWQREPAVVRPEDLAGRGDQDEPGLVLDAVAIRDPAGGVQGDWVGERRAEAAQVGADGLGR